jgi:hypothetical protein
MEQPPQTRKLAVPKEQTMPQLQDESRSQQTELRNLLRLQEQAYRRMRSQQQTDAPDDSDLDTDAELAKEGAKAACEDATPHERM